MTKREQNEFDTLRAEHARLRLAYMALYQQHLDLLECMQEIVKGLAEDDG